MQHSTKFRVKVAGVALAAVLAGGGTAGAASATSIFGLARHGADDPAPQHHPDDPAGHGRHGADDPIGHGRHGADDPANHG